MTTMATITKGKKEEERKGRVTPPKTVVMPTPGKSVAEKPSSTKQTRTVETTGGTPYAIQPSVPIKVVKQEPVYISMPTAGKTYAELSASDKYKFWLQDNKNREQKGLGTDWKLAINFLGNTAVELGMKQIEGAKELASRYNDDPIQDRLVYGMAGIFGSPALMVGEGMKNLSGGEDLQQKPAYVKGISSVAFGVAGATGTGAVFNAVFNQPEVVDAMTEFTEFKEKNLEKLYKTKIGGMIGQEGKDALSLGVDLMALAVIHKTAQVPFKTTKTVEVKSPEGTVLAKVPVDRQWWGNVKNEFKTDAQKIFKDPIGYIEEHQLGLSIKDVSGDGFKGTPQNNQDLPGNVPQDAPSSPSIPDLAKGEIKTPDKMAPDNYLNHKQTELSPSQSSQTQYPTQGQTSKQPLQQEQSQSQLSGGMQKNGSYNGSIVQSQKLARTIEKTAKQLNQPVKQVSSMFNRIKDFTTKSIEYFQDAEIRVKQLMERPDLKISDISNPYQKAALYPGKVSTKIQKGYEEAKIITNDIKTISNELKVDLSTIKKEVNDYLISQHAPERNSALGEGAAGITTKDALVRISEIEKSPQGKKIKEISDKALKLNEQTLELLKDSGVITKELYSTLKDKYKKHVPLQRILEETTDVGSIMSGKGFDVKSSGVKKAKGSQLEVDDILANIVTNYEQAVLRSEKNIVDQATLAFVRENEAVLKGLMEVKKPKAIGKDFEGKFLTEKTNDPTILQLFEDGRPVWIKINDQNLAIALRGVGREKLPSILKPVQYITNFYAMVATRFNPEFALPNKIRDLQETGIFLASQKDVNFKGALNTIKRDVLLKNTKAVFDALRGKNSEGAKLYNEMKDLGGTTGGFGLSTKEQVKLNISEIENLATSKTKKIANNVVEYVDAWNTIFEDSTRLSVYRQALEQGISKDRAAFLAKEASINFNRMGKGGPVINALYMFSNAAIQGSSKMIRSLKNPKVAAAVALTMGTAVSGVNTWNDMVDPNWRDKVTKWDRLNGLPVMLPSEDGSVHYFVIPVSWGLKPIKVMTDYAYDAISGQKVTANSAIKDTAISILEAYNPIGGSDLISAITPTILDMPFEIARNRSWNGNKIRPDFDQNAPDDIQYFDSLSETLTGRVAISISEILEQKGGVAISPANIKYAFDTLVGGAGRSVAKTANAAYGVATGDSPPVDEYPFISRFYRNQTEQEVVENSSGIDDKDEIGSLLQEQSRDRFNLKNEAQILDKELLSLPPDEANARLAEVKKENKPLYEKLKEVMDERKLNLSYTEKKIKQLGVDNGERAAYISKQLDKLETQEERDAYGQNLEAKKIITDDIKAQLKKIKEAGGLQQKLIDEAAEATDEKTMADTAKLYIKAFGVDPLTALETLFTTEQLKDVRGEVAIMERMGIEKSQAIKEKGGAGPTDKLDHIVSLQLGGDNSLSNLRIVTEAEWKSFTPVENYLGKLVNKGIIGNNKAAQLITDFKDGEISFEEIKAQYK